MKPEDAGSRGAGRPVRALPVEDYALIGDTHTAALVGRNGSIDWLCLPRLDSGACFAALLGTEDHGFWRIAPAAEPDRVERRYRGQTLVLETEFRTHAGVVRLVDCMPRRSGTGGWAAVLAEGLRTSIGTSARRRAGSCGQHRRRAESALSPVPASHGAIRPRACRVASCSSTLRHVPPEYGRAQSVYVSSPP